MKPELTDFRNLNIKYSPFKGKPLHHFLLQARTNDIQSSGIGSLDKIPMGMVGPRKSFTFQLPNGRLDYHVFLGDMQLLVTFANMAKEFVKRFPLYELSGCPARLGERSPEKVWAATLHLISSRQQKQGLTADRRAYIRLTREEWLETNDPELWTEFEPENTGLRSAVAEQFENRTAGPILGLRCSLLEDDLFTASFAAVQWLRNEYQTAV